MSRLLLAVVVVFGFVINLPAARANGRFPTSTNVHFAPGQTQTILVPVTFGLLVSTDGGANFDWICESAIGYAGTYDPVYSVAADGAVFATNFQGVRVARNGLCDWQAVPDLASHWVSDIKVGSDSRVWATTFTLTDGSVNDVFVSTDNGVSFSSGGPGRDDVTFRSIVIAPGDANRLYVSGYLFTPPNADGGFPTLSHIGFRSENGGTSWDTVTTSGFSIENQTQLIMAAVAPDNPDVVYARLEKGNVPSGDVLYRSDNKGVDWTEILRTAEPMRAILVQAAGKVIVGTLGAGVQISANSGDTWTSPPQQPPMNCIGVRSDGLLFTCGLNWEPSFFAIATSSDGMTWTPMMRFCEIRGPLACDVGTIQRDTCSLVDSSPDVVTWGDVMVQVAVGNCDAPPGGDAGLGFFDAGSSDGGGGPDGPTADAGSTKSPDTCGGCGAGGSAAATLMVLFPLLFRRRRSKT